MKYTGTFAVFVIVALLVGCEAAEDASQAGKPSAPPPAKIGVATIDKMSLTIPRLLLGEVHNAESTILAAGGAGNVLRVNVREGDSVKRGQLLVQIDDGVLRAQLKQAQAELKRSQVELAQAERDTKRLKALSEQGHYPEREAEQIGVTKQSLEAAVAGHEAAIQRLREEISQMRIVAPFDGVVAARHVAPGQWLRTGEPAVEVASSGQLEVHVQVPSELLGRVGSETDVELGDTQKIKGSIAGVVGSLDKRSRTALLRIMPEVSPEWLREGDAIDVHIKIDRAQEGVVVPTDALVQGVAGTRVFRIVDGKAEPHAVEVLAQSGTNALVKAPMLKMGDTLVVRGNERLRPGQDVEVVQ